MRMLLSSHRPDEWTIATTRTRDLNQGSRLVPLLIGPGFCPTATQMVNGWRYQDVLCRLCLRVLGDLFLSRELLLSSRDRFISRARLLSTKALFLSTWVLPFPRDLFLTQDLLLSRALLSSRALLLSNREFLLSRALLLSNMEFLLSRDLLISRALLLSTRAMLLSTRALLISTRDLSIPTRDLLFFGNLFLRRDLLLLRALALSRVHIQGQGSPLTPKPAITPFRHSASKLSLLSAKTFGRPFPR